VLDLSRPYKGSAELAVDAFATYSLRKLATLRLKSDWRLQLNARNLTDSRGLVPTQVTTNGVPSIYTYRTPRQFIVSVQVEL
jgi:outer membrane receptor protein involved in Fe transport